MTPTRSLRVGVDTGGTFTDVVVLDEVTGRLTTTKTPSTPADPAEGFLTGADKALDAADATWDAVASVFHGTTVATNALLQGTVAGLGSSPPPGSATCWRSAARASPTATATRTSG